jgi:hypothetical protein
MPDIGVAVAVGLALLLALVLLPDDEHAPTAAASTVNPATDQAATRNRRRLLTNATVRPDRPGTLSLTRNPSSAKPRITNWV